MTEIRPILWDDGRLKLLDQTQLPKSETVVEVTGYRGAISAIRNMQVRGAPAIGITAAYGVAMAARDIHADSHPDFMAQLRQAASEIESARPTAVNLQWAVRRMLAVAEAEPDPSRLPQALLAEASRIQEEDEAVNRRMGEAGQDLIPEGGSVLTHCNAGALGYRRLRDRRRRH